MTEEEIEGLKDLIMEHLEDAFRGASEMFLRRVIDDLTPDILDYVNAVRQEELEETEGY